MRMIFLCVAAAYGVIWDDSTYLKPLQTASVERALPQDSPAWIGETVKIAASDNTD